MHTHVRNELWTYTSGETGPRTFALNSPVCETSSIERLHSAFLGCRLRQYVQEIVTQSLVDFVATRTCDGGQSASERSRTKSYGLLFEWSGASQTDRVWHWQV